MDNKLKYALSLDIGGSFVKSAIVGSDGVLLEKSFQTVPINSQGSKKEIIETFTRTIESAFRMAEDLKIEIMGIGISIPGPFNYKECFSLMKHKFHAIYGLDLKQEFIKRLSLTEDFLIRFEHDAHAFLRGEVWRGAAQGYSRVVGITLGTGLGAAFMADNKIMANSSGGPLYSIWNMPYEDGIVEDKVSKGGIIAGYKKLVKQSPDDFGVKEIASLALKEKDKISLQVFKETGFVLGSVLKPILFDFKAECLVVGGQISKSFSFFAKSLRNQLDSVSTLKKVTHALSIDFSPLYGVANFVFQSLYTEPY